MMEANVATTADRTGITHRGTDATWVKRLIHPMIAVKQLSDQLHDAINLPAPDYERLKSLPSPFDTIDAMDFLEEALGTPCEARVARGLIVKYLDYLGRPAGPNAQNQIDGLVHVVVEDCSIDHEVDRHAPISAPALALAIHRLLQTSKFAATPAELHGACLIARGSIGKLLDRLHDGHSKASELRARCLPKASRQVRPSEDDADEPF
jgi:hypothetical protein